MGCGVSKSVVYVGACMCEVYGVVQGVWMEIIMQKANNKRKAWRAGKAAGPLCLTRKDIEKAV